MHWISIALAESSQADRWSCINQAQRKHVTEF